MSVPILAAAALLSWRFGGLAIERGPAPPAPERSRLTRSGRFLRAAVVSLSSGLIAGVAVAGFGGRLMMRLAAATSPASVQGAQTSAQETVGEITFGGSAFLIAFVGLLIAPSVGFAYRLVRRWLPGPAAAAGITLAAIAAALVGRAIDLTSPDNIDFEILSPRPLIALMIGVLIVLYGTTLAASHEWLDRRVSMLGRSPRTWVGYVPAAMSFINFFLLPILVATTLVASLLPVGFTDRLVRPTPLRVGRWFAALVGAAAGAFVLSDLVRIAI